MSGETSENIKAIVIAPNRVVPSTESRRQMDLEEAKEILNRAIQFNVALINERTDFSKPAGIDYRDLWQALSVVGNNITNTYPNLKRAGRGVGKTAPEGTVEMFIDEYGINLRLYKGTSGTFLIEADLPISNDDPLTRYRGYLDYRQNHLAPYEKLTNSEKLKNAWTGVRWISANLLGWDGPYITPEDIGSNNNLKLAAPTNP